jgi:hypothetical protein
MNYLEEKIIEAKMMEMTMRMIRQHMPDMIAKPEVKKEEPKEDTWTRSHSDNDIILD